MGRGNSTLDKSDLFYIKITGLKEGEEIHMTQRQATKEGVVDIPEPIYDIMGDFVKAEVRQYQWKGDDIYDIKLVLKDPTQGPNGEVYIVSCGLNSVGRSMLNSMLSVGRTIKNLRIEVKMKKDKKGVERPNAYLNANGDQTSLKWKYQPSELEPYIETNMVKKKGKMVEEKDFSKLDDFLVAEFNKVFSTSTGHEEEHFDTEAPFVTDEPQEQQVGQDVPAPEEETGLGDLPDWVKG
jgi:hypothetical protein